MYVWDRKWEKNFDSNKYSTGSSMVFINGEWQLVLVTVQRCEERILNTNLTDESVIQVLERYSLFSCKNEISLNLSDNRDIEKNIFFFFFFVHLQFKFAEAAFLIDDWMREVHFSRIIWPVSSLGFLSARIPREFFLGEMSPPLAPSLAPLFSCSPSAVDPSRVLRAHLCLISQRC